MRYFCQALGALLVCLTLGCEPEPAAEPGLLELAERFREANQADSIEPMLRLYHLEGADERTVGLLKATLEYELGMPVQQIEFEPLQGAPEETIDFEHEGARYGPTLEPRYRMRVRYDAEDGFTSLFTVGRTDAGEWKIISAKPKAAADQQTRTGDGDD
ncbi:MAG: hypothetical protein ACLFS4_01380 [Opitutales bacterium]